MNQRRPMRAAAALGALLLGGCSGTPFGDRLAESFSSAPGLQEQPRPPASPQTTTAAAPAGNPAKPAPRVEPARPVAVPSRAKEPAPYRITIRLPSGDPSAPAEVVTQALRAAGVAFEVEMIERISSDGAASAATPAPAAPRNR